MFLYIKIHSLYLFKLFYSKLNKVKLKFQQIAFFKISFIENVPLVSESNIF